jgi:hypothetical protein
MLKFYVCFTGSHKTYINIKVFMFKFYGIPYEIEFNVHFT